MSLPVINSPTYELEIPSTKEKLVYRPFLVKEEKILLMAQEDGNEASIARAMKQIVHNCTFDNLDVDNMPLFDLEYLFLQIRSKSVGEVAKVSVLCKDDNKTYAEVEIPLDEVKVKFQKGHNNKIELTDNIGVVMIYPTLDVMESGLNLESTEGIFKMIGHCIGLIYEGEELHQKGDFTQKELDTFLESLTADQFQKLQTFFETMPKLSYKLEVVNPKTKKKNKITLEGLQSFFA
jgi:hypothetical protein